MVTVFGGTRRAAARATPSDRVFVLLIEAGLAIAGLLFLTGLA